MRSRVATSIRFLAWVSGLAIVAGCGKIDGPGTGPGGSIVIEISKSALTIVQGGSDNLTATIARSGGFTGTVTIATEGAPPGVTAAASNVTTTGTTTTGTVTVSVAASVAPGTYNLTVRASGSGVDAVTKALTLTVTALPAIGITLTGSPLAVVQGASGSVTVNLTRTNFPGSVNLTVEGAPPGVTGTFNPAEVSGTTSTLTIQVAASVAAGSYNLTVRAAGQGVAAQTAALALTVTLMPQDIGLSLNPPTISLAQGASGDVAVTLTRTNFTANINLTLEGAPQGVTGTFAPAAATGTASTLTLQVGASVVAGSYNLVVRAAGQGVTDKTAPLALTVTAVVTGSYTLATTPGGTVTLQQGASTSPAVNINRTGGFTGSVSLTVTGAPVGLTATLNPTSTTGNSSALTVTASASLATGNYQLTILGTAAGVANQSVNLTVTITSGSGGSGNVSLDYSACSLSERPIWLAFQDGTSGPWTRVTPANNVFTFNITQSKGGVAAVFAVSGSNTLSIQYFSQAELTGLSGAASCPAAPGGKTVTGSTANLTALQTASISLGGAFAGATLGAPNFTLSNVASGNQDLVGYAGSLLGPSASDRVVIQRDLNPAADGSVGTIDFTGGSSFAPASGSITLTNAGTDMINHIMGYLVGNCTAAALYAIGPVSGTTFTAYGIPGAQQRASDLHSLSVLAADGAGTSTRSAIEYFAALGNRNFALPAAMPVPTVAVLAGPYKRLQFQFTLPAEYSQSVTVAYSESGSGNDVVLIATVAGYLGGQAVNLSVPDLSGVSGWDNAWAPASAATVMWNAAGSGSNLTSACSAGGRLVTAARTGQN
ncbi:MAG: beta strand repeat-containing protein [Gemmatimonadales bacterium]